MLNEQITTSLPLTQNQTAIWLDEQLFDPSPMYNIGAYYPIRGSFEPQILYHALRRVIRENEVFGLRIELANPNDLNDVIPLQCFEPVDDYNLPVYDFSDSVDAEQLCIEWMKERFQQPFDLNRRPLFEFALLKASERCYFWFFKMHHLAIDGWGYAVLVQQVETYYNEMSGVLLEGPKPTYSYSEYVADELAYYGSAAFEQDKTYWVNKFEDLPPALRESVDPVAGRQGLLPASKTLLTIPRSRYAHLEAFAKEKQASLLHVWLALFATYFYRITGQRRLCIGIPVLNRGKHTFKRTIGLFTGLLPLVIEIGEGLSFSQLVLQIKSTLRRDYRHQRFPIQELLRSLTAQTLGARSLQDVTLSYEKQDYDLNFNGTTTRIHSMTGNRQKTPLGLFIREYSPESDVMLDIDFLEAYFPAWEVECMKQRLEVLMESAMNESDEVLERLPIMPEQEKQLLLETFNDTKVDFPGTKTISQLFEEQVEKTPDHTALVFEEVQLTYRELNEKANRLAHALREQFAIQPDDIIALQLERSEWMVIAILGVLKSGAAYLPIAPDAPKARATYMLRDSTAMLLLTDSLTYTQAKETGYNIPVLNVDNLQSDRSMNLPAITGSKHLAYIIYTSGSTGQPKGVLIEHRSLVDFVLFAVPAYSITDTDKLIQAAPYTFDTSVEEIFSTLSAGAALFVIDHHTLLNPDSLLEFIFKNRISILDFTPALLAGLNKAELPFVKTIITGGDAADKSAVKFYSQRHTYINGYGPTESTVTIATYVVEAARVDEFPTVPIGKPNANTEIFILGPDLLLQPLGIPGELCVSGIGLARGYLNRPDLTAEKFVPHPFMSGERLYRTGDLARVLPDGNIEFLGRIDHQLKIRGYRIEAGEIEQALLKHAAIQSAVVIGQELAGSKELVAYLVPASNQALPDSGELRRFLEEKLPRYMIPGYFVSLERLPLTSNGKVNRQALAQAKSDIIYLGGPFVAPRNSVELRLAHIWQEVLNREQISIQDDFFTLGGHSLRALQLISRIKRSFNIDFPLSAVFQYSRLADMAQRLQNTTLERGSIALQLSSGNQCPIFAFPPALGLAVFFQPMASRLVDQPVYAFDFEPQSDRLQLYYSEIKKIQPGGPYRLLGYSAGGNLAFELAQYLEERGETIGELILIDSSVMIKEYSLPESQLLQTAQAELDYISALPHSTDIKQLFDDPLTGPSVKERMLAFYRYHNQNFTRGQINAPVHVLLSNESYDGLDTRKFWGRHTTGGCEWYVGQGEHLAMFLPPNLDDNIQLIGEILLYPERNLMRQF